MSIYYSGKLVSDDEILYTSEGTTDMQFECTVGQDIPDNFMVTQQWTFDQELDSEQYWSSDKSAYILKIFQAKNIKITCRMELDSEDYGLPTVVLTSAFSIKGECIINY